MSPRAAGIEGRESAPGVEYVSIAAATQEHPRNDETPSGIASLRFRVGGKSWGHRKNLEDDPAFELSNLACAYTSAGAVLITYFTPGMAKPEPPERLGRAAMSLKGALVDVAWLYR